MNTFKSKNLNQRDHLPDQVIDGSITDLL